MKTLRKQITVLHDGDFNEHG